jgi:hypothetical protein
VPYAQRVKADVGLPTHRRRPDHRAGTGRAIIAAGEADAVSLARAMLYDPRWPWHAAARLGARRRAAAVLALAAARVQGPVRRLALRAALAASKPIPMTYRLKLHEADASPQELRDAEQRFRQALDESLGDASLVAPMYTAYQRIVGVHGEEFDEEVLSEAERLVFNQWRTAELAAVTAAFGPNRYMGDAMYEIRL